MSRLKTTLAMAALLFLAPGLCLRAEDMAQIKGSDTLINMVQKLAEVYMDKKPGTGIAVTGGGSGTGIAALINKNCDIANASRQIKASEVEQANKKGVDPKRIVVAIDALSIIVSARNPVDGLTVDQIGKIYRGEIKNWSEVGGNDLPVALYGRQSNSGTYDFMKENVMFGEYSPNLKSMNGNAQIAEALKQDASGIGYVGVGYAREATGIKVLKVATKVGATYYDPFNMADVKSGRYPITRPLNQYINNTPKGLTKSFLEFELSAEGQAIVEKEGFFAIPDEYQTYNDQTLGRSGRIRESPMRPKDLETNLGAG
ncbi:MAG: PstS family phosphate ABC transporter substrate-binding protein [Candidatus Omnitrophota bacterium]|nr:PstS family phosphate ABC transporter substrate-binding protein [Candidatus Omnitrophota bacterium]